MKLTVEESLEQGADLEAAAKPSEAIEIYEAALRLEPNNPQINHRLGILLMEGQKLFGALPFLRRALEEKPSDIIYWQSYINILIALGKHAEAKKIIQQAKDRGAKGSDFEKLSFKLDNLDKEDTGSGLRRLEQPSSDSVHSISDLYNQGEFETVIIEAEKSLGQFPGSAPLLQFSGMAHADIGEFKKSIACYKSLIKLQPNNANALNGLGSSLQQDGQLTAAMKCFEQASVKNPDFAEPHYNKANLLRDAGKLEAAALSYKAALEIRSNFFEALVNLGDVLQNSGELDSAIEKYKEALKIEPNILLAHFNLGNAWKEKGQLPLAAASYESALKIDPNYIDAHYNLGIAHQKMGLLSRAIHIFKDLLKLSPMFYGAYINMGNAFADIGDIKSARDCYKKALKIKPNYSKTYFNFFVISHKINDAITWLEKSVSADSKHIEAKLMLAGVKAFKGDSAEYDKILVKAAYNEHPYIRSFAWVFALDEVPSLYFERYSFFDAIIQLSDHSRPFYEFGVWRGESFKYLMRTFKAGFGFDTFSGLPEEWHDFMEGSYSSEGEVPDIKGGAFISGRFEDTLPEFFSKTRPKASIINFDADLYSATICALNFSKRVIDKHTILIFDEFLMNDNWEEDEFKALEEFCASNNLQYEVIAVSFATKQVALKIIQM